MCIDCKVLRIQIARVSPQKVPLAIGRQKNRKETKPTGQVYHSWWV